MKCKSLVEFYHKGDVSDTELADVLNRLSREGWVEIEWGKNKMDTEVYQIPVYTVDATREVCRCVVPELSK